MSSRKAPPDERKHRMQRVVTKTHEDWLATGDRDKGSEISGVSLVTMRLIDRAQSSVVLVSLGINFAIGL